MVENWVLGIGLNFGSAGADFVEIIFQTKAKVLSCLTKALRGLIEGGAAFGTDVWVGIIQ
jgi:hypothetical protein